MANQLNMGEVIRAVASVPAEAKVKFDTGRYFGYPHSYRGYHDELAISGNEENKVTADDALVRLGAILGEEIGESQYEMTAKTPVWHSNYGEVESLAIVGYRISKKGNLIFQTEYRDW